MLLAFNTIITEKYKFGFDEKTLPFIMNGFPFEIVHLGDETLTQFTSDNKLFSKYSHLLITGSSLSASQGSKWNEIIISIIKYFVKMGRPILGICHGHQMIAKAIAGDDVCRKVEIPEFGWKNIKIKKNHIFKGISIPVFLESHYDEVYNLPEEFNIIAANSDCAVQAFQYRNLPIWGVQFHPEMQYDDGNEMVQEHLNDNPQDSKFYKDELKSKTQIDQNFNIFKNFISSKSQE